MVYTPNPSVPNPLRILDHWLSLHGLLLGPLLPRRVLNKRAGQRAPWLTWEATSKLTRDAKAALVPVETEGIWALTGEKAARTHDPHGDDQDNVAARIPTERGWFVLAFLAALWEEEARAGTFESFMAQMGRVDATRVPDDAKSLFAAVEAAFPTSLDPLPDGGMLFQTTAQRLVALLFTAARAGKFLPREVVSNLSAIMVKHDNPLALACLLGGLCTADEDAMAHVYVAALEKAGGFRERREAARRKKSVSEEQGLAAPFGPPTVKYALQLVTEVAKEPCDIIHYHLLAALPRDDVAWKTVDDKYLEALDNAGRGTLRKSIALWASNA